MSVTFLFGSCVGVGVGGTGVEVGSLVFVGLGTGLVVVVGGLVGNGLVGTGGVVVVGTGLVGTGLVVVVGTGLVGTGLVGTGGVVVVGTGLGLGLGLLVGTGVVVMVGTGLVGVGIEVVVGTGVCVCPGRLGSCPRRSIKPPIQSTMALRGFGIV